MKNPAIDNVTLIVIYKFIILFLFSSYSYGSEDLSGLINQLEKETSSKEIYDKRKQQRIDSLIQITYNTADKKKRYQVYLNIFEEYQFYNFDKALDFIEKSIDIATELENENYVNDSMLKLGLLLVNTGRYKESIDALNDVERMTLSDSLLDKYYIAYNEGYSGLSFNTTVKSSKYNYRLLYSAYQDSLYSRLRVDSEESLRIKEKEYRDSRNLEMALRINSQRLTKVDTNSRLYSLITFERSLLYELRNETGKQKRYLILSAISDIKSSVKDNASLGALARIFFKEGDIDLAHRYINLSYEDAEFFNSKLRFVNIANSMPLISKAYEDKNAKQKSKLQSSLLFISVLALFLLVAFYLIYKQVRKLSIARNQLKKANEDLKQLYQELSAVDEVKEHYIGTFLNLYSEYITKLDVYRKLVSKYVKANQMNALLKLSKSKQFIDEELEIFNKNFDNSFLHIHPNFVSSVNGLLLEDKKIKLEEESELNTELRILALIKLGITSSSQIAKILRYSVNTIYNYRSAIKNMAKDKASFEDLVKKIQ